MCASASTGVWPGPLSAMWTHRVSRGEVPEPELAGGTDGADFLNSMNADVNMKPSSIGGHTAVHISHCYGTSNDGARYATVGIHCC